jgi:hypothetical protein
LVSAPVNGELSEAWDIAVEPSFAVSIFFDYETDISV